MASRASIEHRADIAWSVVRNLPEALNNGLRRETSAAVEALDIKTWFANGSEMADAKERAIKVRKSVFGRESCVIE